MMVILDSNLITVIIEGEKHPDYERWQARARGADRVLTLQRLLWDGWRGA